MQKLIVLVIESSDILFFSGFKKLLNNERLEIIRVSTSEEGEKKFLENHEKIDLIIMGDCNTSNLMCLVKKIVKIGFDKPIIASSSYSQSSIKLKGVGATHFSYKEDVAQMAIELLGL